MVGSEEGLLELRNDVLRGLYLGASRKMSEALGSAVMIETLRPYYENWGSAGANTMKERLGATETPEQVCKASWVVGRMIFHSFDGVIGLHENGASLTTTNCFAAAEHQELCALYCSYASSSFASRLNPRARSAVVASMACGDRYCLKQFTVGRDPNGDIGKKLSDLTPPSVSADDLDYWGSAATGEAWTFTTRAFLEVAGREALPGLTERAHAFGLEMSPRILASSIPTKEGRADVIDILATIRSIMRTVGNTTARSDSILDRETIECPFSGAPVEVCYQMEGFIEGVLEGIGKGYEMRHDRMMPNGDRSCHWTIRMKEEVASSGREGDTIRMARETLGRRLASGEITVDEYDRIMDRLERI
ncbi:MAG TPA: hypothetical protein VMB46_07325 [Methanomassiliicoccales archaeon]|nr:hypothetical protein [Methanomassiliicoccales archaeon]